MTAMHHAWARAVSLGAATAGRFVRHRLATHAAALAYRGALALFPFLLLVVGFAHAIGFDAVTEWLRARAARGQQSGSGGALVEWIGARLGAPPDRGLLSVGAATAIWSVSAGVRGLRQALAVSVDATDAGAEPGWRQFIVSFGVTPVLAVIVVLAAASLLVTSRAIEVAFGWLGWDVALGATLAVLRVPVVLVVIACLLAAVYQLTPGVRRSFRSVLPGAVLAAVSWTVVSLGFSRALATVLDYGATYGSFGAAIALLVYLQLSAAVLLLGAEVNAVLRADRLLEHEGHPRLDPRAVREVGEHQRARGTAE